MEEKSTSITAESTFERSMVLVSTGEQARLIYYGILLERTISTIVRIQGTVRPLPRATTIRLTTPSSASGLRISAATTGFTKKESQVTLR